MMSWSFAFVVDNLSDVDEHAVAARTEYLSAATDEFKAEVNEQSVAAIEAAGMLADALDTPHVDERFTFTLSGHLGADGTQKSISVTVGAYPKPAFEE